MGADIVIVEADDSLREDYGAWLRDEGYPVLSAANGLEALEFARAHKPALVVMNLDLGEGLDGWEIARVLRKDLATRGVRILALVGEKAKCRAQDGRSARCDGVLNAPTLRKVLVAAVRRHVRH
jgi:CheY-like chemotaxis protein